MTEERSCNCPWTECAAHAGSLCSRDALPGIDCDSCGIKHYIGDITISEGIALCGACAGAYLQIMAVGPHLLMQKLQEYVPSELMSINGFFARHWEERLAHPSGWFDIIADNVALYEFIGLFIGHIPIPKLLVVSAQLKQFKKMHEALRPRKLPVIT